MVRAKSAWRQTLGIKEDMAREPVVGLGGGGVWRPGYSEGVIWERRALWSEGLWAEWLARRAKRS